MATLMERDIALVTKDSSGNNVIEYPVTRAAQVEDLDSAVAAVKVNSAASADSATKLATARTIQTNLASATAASFNGTANVTPGVTGTLPIANGGTGNTTGLAASATKLATARTIRTNLASTSTASFDGTAAITPGVTGTLPVANGGTGVTSLASLKTALGISSSGGASVLPYATCSTALATLAKVATVANSIDFSLTTGAVCLVKFSYTGNCSTSGTTMTLNINSTGAKTLKTKERYGYFVIPAVTAVMYNGTDYTNNPFSGITADYNDYSDAG